MIHPEPISGRDWEWSFCGRVARPRSSTCPSAPVSLLHLVCHSYILSKNVTSIAVWNNPPAEQVYWDAMGLFLTAML